MKMTNHFEIQTLRLFRMSKQISNVRVFLLISGCHIHTQTIIQLSKRNIMAILTKHMRTCSHTLYPLIILMPVEIPSNPRIYQC